MPKSNTIPAVAVHTLPEALLEKPLAERFELALQHWMDLYPASTSLRFGHECDCESDMVYLTENMYGPRLEVMTLIESYSKEAKLDERKTLSDARRVDVIAEKLGVRLRPMLESDPSAQWYYTPQKNLQYAFRTELVTALNYGLNEVGCRTHSVRLSDHTDAYMKLYKECRSENRSENDKEKAYKAMKKLEDPNATLVWQKKDAFSPETPGAAVYEALAKYFTSFPGHPVPNHVTLNDTIEVKPLDASKWTPMAQTEVERLVMKAKSDLSNPAHPWVVARGTGKDGQPNDPLLYAYIASQYASPAVRNGQLLFEGLRFDTATDEGVGYVIVGSESCGTMGINRDIEEMLRDASAGQCSQVALNYSDLPDVLVSAAYHAQAVAHQQEQAAWAQLHPVEHTPGTGPLITKPVAKLKVGDHVGVSSTSEGEPDLWCKVTKREGDVVTLFVHNGHWDFQLNTATNQSLDHDIVSNFEGKAHVMYTAPIPIQNGALYNDALEFMQDHARRAAATPSATASM